MVCWSERYSEVIRTAGDIVNMTPFVPEENRETTCAPACSAFRQRKPEETSSWSENGAFEQSMYNLNHNMLAKISEAPLKIAVRGGFDARQLRFKTVPYGGSLIPLQVIETA